MKAIVVEDDPKTRKTLGELILGSGHELIGCFNSRSEFEESIDKIPGVELAVVDGSVPNEEDGEAIAQQIRERFPDCLVVIYSSAQKSQFQSAQVFLQKGADLPILRALLGNLAPSYQSRVAG